MDSRGRTLLQDLAVHTTDPTNWARTKDTRPLRECESFGSSPRKDPVSFKKPGSEIKTHPVSDPILKDSQPLSRPLITGRLGNALPGGASD